MNLDWRDKEIETWPLDLQPGGMLGSLSVDCGSPESCQLNGECIAWPGYSCGCIVSLTHQSVSLIALFRWAAWIRSHMLWTQRCQGCHLLLSWRHIPHCCLGSMLHLSQSHAACVEWRRPTRGVPRLPERLINNLNPQEEKLLAGTGGCLHKPLSTDQEQNIEPQYFICTRLFFYCI